MAVRWPAGVRAAGVACGIKPSGAPDLGVLAFESPCAWAGTFTRNAAAAAPVLWCRERAGAPAAAVVVNSGNANACTGTAGREAVAVTALAASEAIDCDPNQVLVASTGTIGVPLPVELIVASLPGAFAALSDGVDGFANSILTTDTTMKTSYRRAGNAAVVGVAKGAAMIAPNMATMLAFITTDATADSGLLRRCLGSAVDRTFNRVSIDGCESTNDSVFLFSTGVAGRVAPDVLGAAVESVCADLAEQIARDAEGASKLVRIRVTGAPTEARALEAGRAVADSALWRAAASGADPNWGRVLSAIGSADADLDLDRASVSICGVPMFVMGEPTGDRQEGARAMAAPEITVDCDLGSGTGTADVVSADLTIDYVKLNAEGSS
jgi:glutamate N-acetyltransferase/amino-acid N-acetyltransferase